MTDRQVGSEGLQVDIKPPLSNTPQLGSLALQLDFTYPKGVQFGSVLANVDVTPIHPNGWMGSISLMVDLIVSAVAANAARWSGTAFEMGTSSPLTYWSGTAFSSSGTKPVLWVTDHFEVAP